MSLNSSNHSNKEPIIFNKDRRDYYINKRLELKREKESNRVIKEDSMFIHYYGMEAYLTLFPEARDFGMEWHRSVIKELQSIDKRNLGSLIAGISLAVGSNLSQKANRKLKRILKNMSKG